MEYKANDTRLPHSRSPCACSLWQFVALLRIIKIFVTHTHWKQKRHFSVGKVKNQKSGEKSNNYCNENLISLSLSQTHSLSHSQPFAYTLLRLFLTSLSLISLAIHTSSITFLVLHLISHNHTNNSSDFLQIKQSLSLSKCVCLGT